MKIFKRSILLCIIILFFNSIAMLNAGTRTSPFEPPNETDTVIIVDDSSGLDTGCTFRNSGPLIIKMTMPRYVGEVDSNGYLKNVSTLVNKKIISEKAILTLPAYDVDYEADVQQYGFNPERDVITFNDVPVKRTGTAESYLYGKNNTWILNSFEIPIEIIKFAKKGAPAENATSQNN